MLKKGIRNRYIKYINTESYTDETYILGAQQVKFITSTEMFDFYNSMFKNRDDLIKAVDLWDSNRSECIKKYGSIENWDTLNVTDMDGLFYNLENFNSDISKWRTDNVTDMRQMFHNCKTFNININNWNVKKVRNMSQMFYNAEKFNQELFNWDTHSVTDMVRVCSLGAKEFNSPIYHFITYKVIDTGYMFYKAENFNQPIKTERFH